jgi:hypothetical protein
LSNEGSTTSKESVLVDKNLYDSLDIFFIKELSGKIKLEILIV